MSGTPTAALGTLRPDLGTMMQFDLEQDRQGFVGLQVLRPMEIAEQAITWGKIKLESLLQNRDTKRTDDGSYPRGTYNFTTDTVATEEGGLEERVDRRRAARYRHYFDAEVVAAMRTRDGVLREQEKRIAALVFNTATWAGAALTTAAGIPWSTFATAAPITDVEAACRKVWDGTGIWPNAIVLSKRKFRDLRLCTTVKDVIASTGAGDSVKAGGITKEMLAQVFDLKYVIVAGGAFNSANEAQARSVASIWSNTQAMVCRVAETDNIEEPCIGRTFHWAEDDSEIGTVYETYYDESRRSDIVRNRHDVKEKVLYTELGHLLTSL